MTLPLQLLDEQQVTIENLRRVKKKESIKIIALLQGYVKVKPKGYYQVQLKKEQAQFFHYLTAQLHNLQYLLLKKKKKKQKKFHKQKKKKKNKQKKKNEKTNKNKNTNQTNPKSKKKQKNKHKNKQKTKTKNKTHKKQTKNQINKKEKVEYVKTNDTAYWQFMQLKLNDLRGDGTVYYLFDASNKQ